MTPFVTHRGIVAPLNRSNIDTDQIIPKQFLKRIERTGFGQFLFYDWRFDEPGQPKPDFILNQSPYDRASILVTAGNFGCGSSREHAPWALQDFGFRVIIAPSYADIFYNNCFQNGLLPIVLPESEVEYLQTSAAEHPGFRITVNLEDQLLTNLDGTWRIKFAIDPERRQRLLQGLDAIGQTLLFEDIIRAYEVSHDPVS